MIIIWYAEPIIKLKSVNASSSVREIKAESRIRKHCAKVFQTEKKEKSL